MDESLRERLREMLLSLYGVDIDEAAFHFSTQNYAFVFPDKPYMIRVSMTPKKTRKEILSELMWVDDLKQFKETICEPSDSLRGNLLEEFEIDGISYRASMFRTARGNVKVTADMNAMYFICVGDLLGTIHKVSTEERIMGMHYQRSSMDERFDEYKKTTFQDMDPGVVKRIEAIDEKVRGLSRHPGKYGICHGDFHSKNFFVEANNIWLFDFDGCVYADYMYDVAAFVQDCLMVGYMGEKDARAVLNEDIMPYFKIGYSLNKSISDNYWEDLELFIAYRAALASMALSQIKVCGVNNNLDSVKQFYNFLLTQDNILDAITLMRRKRT